MISQRWRLIKNLENALNTEKRATIENVWKNITSAFSLAKMLKNWKNVEINLALGQYLCAIIDNQRCSTVKTKMIYETDLVERLALLLKLALWQAQWQVVNNVTAQYGKIY